MQKIPKEATMFSRAISGRSFIHGRRAYAIGLWAFLLGSTLMGALPCAG